MVKRESSTNRFILRGLFDVLVSVARNTSQPLGLRDTSSTASGWMCVTAKMGTVICCLGAGVLEGSNRSPRHINTRYGCSTR